MASATVQGFLDGPASRPPNGTAVNLDNPPKLNTGPLVLLGFCVVLTLLAILGRAYSRLFVVKRLRIEDYLGLLAALSYIIIVYSFLRYWINVGFFIHMWDLRGVDLVEVSYVGFIINIGYAFLLLFSKTAILLEWVHIFVPKGTRNTFWWSARAMMVANIGLYSSALIVVFAGCQPLQLFWNVWVPGHCIDRKARDTANAAFNVVMDIMILILPQPVIWKLHMTNTRKIGISVVFSVGLLAIVTAVGRLHGIITMDYPTDLTRVFDTSYQFSVELEWIVAELTCVMLVFCVPALPKMISERAVLFTSRITDVWRSWTRLGRDSRVSDTKYIDKNWNEFTPESPPTIGSAPCPGSRQRVTDEELLITNDSNWKQNEALELAAMRDRYIWFQGHAARSPHPGLHPQNNSETGIVKTVEFDRHDDRISKFSPDRNLEIQHPWMEN